MRALLVLLNRLLDWGERLLRRWRDEKHQAEKDELRDNPAAWFDNKFSSGVRNDDDAPETGETPTGSDTPS